MITPATKIFGAMQWQRRINLYNALNLF